MKLYFPYLCILALLASSCFAGVSVSAPSNDSGVSQSVQYVGTASSSCAKGVAAMGVYSAPNHLVYRVNGAALNTELTFSPGTYNTVVQE